MNSQKDSIQRHSVNSISLLTLLTVSFAYGSLMVLGWLDNARGPLFPLILQDLNLSHFQGGLFFAVSSLTAVFTNFLVPTFLRFLNSKAVLLIGLIVLLIFPVLFLMAGHYPMLLLSAFVFGISLGTIAVTLNIVIEQAVPPSSKRFYLSLMHSTYGLSALLAPVLIAKILDAGHSWQKSLVYVWSFGGPVLILGLLSLLLNSYTQPSEKVFSSVRSLKLESDSKKINYKIILFWGLFLALYVSSELFFTTRTVLLFKDYYQYPLSDANFQLTLFFIGLFIGRLFISFVPGHISSFKILNLSLVFTILFIALGLFLNPLFLASIGLWMAAIFPISLDEISNQTGVDFKVYSSLVISISSLGVVIMHMITGLIADNFGIYSSCFIPLGLMIMALLISLNFKNKL